MKDMKKYAYALDVAVAEGFEWDYEYASEEELYEAIEAIGYAWDGTSWRYKP